jgi:hypothetical protein
MRADCRVETDMKAVKHNLCWGATVNNLDVHADIHAASHACAVKDFGCGFKAHGFGDSRLHKFFHYIYCVRCGLH